MSMEIEGFSPLQQEIADQIWALESPDQVVDFFNGLPRSLLPDAYLVYRMIIEHAYDDLDYGECEEAQQAIEHIRNLPC